MDILDDLISQLIDHKIPKEQILEKLKDKYNTEISKSVEPADKNIFFWSSNFVTIYLIADSHGDLAFATHKDNQNKNKITLLDLRSNTDYLEFKNIYSAEKKLAYLDKYNIFSLSKDDKIIPSSLKPSVFSLNVFIQQWIQNEYRISNKSLSLPALELNTIDENTIHQSKFQFREMLSNINDDQFKAEFSEFLFGYNNEKFFLAASAMGSIIEHLLFIILQNYGDERLIGSRRPTADKYLKAMERQQHFNFTDRDSTFIDNIFQTRNSISHYNSGYVLKSQCDMMLMGLNSIYRRFYLPSKAYSINHE